MELDVLTKSKAEKQAKFTEFENSLTQLKNSTTLNCRIAFSGSESVEKIKQDAKKEP